MINKKANKKRELNAPLFKTCVSVDTNGQLIIDHEWVDPKKLLIALEKTSYRYTSASIVRHCISDSVGFDEKINKLLKNI